MVKCLITYTNPTNTFIENITYCKTQEVLVFTTRILQNNNKVDITINELATSNADMIKIRDMLNNLDLGDN